MNIMTKGVPTTHINYDIILCKKKKKKNYDVIISLKSPKGKVRRKS